jgi:hypothetical protein
MGYKEREMEERWGGERMEKGKDEKTSRKEEQISLP